MVRTAHDGFRPFLSAKAVDTESAYWVTVSSCAISTLVSAKSKTCALPSIRSFRADFGMTMKPCWRLHRMRTCAAVFPCASAIETGTGSSRFLPRVRGL